MSKHVVEVLNNLIFSFYSVDATNTSLGLLQPNQDSFGGFDDLGDMGDMEDLENPGNPGENDFKQGYR